MKKGGEIYIFLPIGKYFAYFFPNLLKKHTKLCKTTCNAYKMKDSYPGSTEKSKEHFTLPPNDL